jgi:hypothetical protein
VAARTPLAVFALDPSGMAPLEVGAIRTASLIDR